MPENRRHTQPAFVTCNRHGTYYFRSVIPAPLRDQFGGRREIRRSLQTDSYRTAIVCARAYRAEFDAIIAQLMDRKRRDDAKKV